MGQKVHPTGIRLGITEDWQSIWYAEGNYADNLFADIKVREYLHKELAEAAVSHIRIERPAKNARITIFAARPGVIIGQRGKGVEKLRSQVSKIMGVPVHLNIEEIRKPELDAYLVADSVAKQLEQRVMFRRAMKRAVSSAMRAGAQGVKICVGGRLGGAEIARSEWYREGRVPLHTFRADIDYGVAEAHTTYGVIGVKVWIFKGEKVGKPQEKQQPEAAAEQAEGE
ncbi:MAG: 30S ribosomal protein S3 [Legionellales bacterium]|nr:30S ribosomal protein S3 [Legionellales bacterium]|tara:strand:+ start:3467 stop:4147 length:681 start_codon:yes stop_codon:yes gene_type:complete